MNADGIYVIVIMNADGIYVIVIMNADGIYVIIIMNANGIPFSYTCTCIELCIYSYLSKCNPSKNFFIAL